MTLIFKSYCSEGFLLSEGKWKQLEKKRQLRKVLVGLRNCRTPAVEGLTHSISNVKARL